MCPPGQTRRDLSTTMFQEDPPLGSKRLDMGPLSKRLQVNTVVDRFGPRAIHTFPFLPSGEDHVLQVKGRFGQVLSTGWASRGELLNEEVGGMVGGVRNVSGMLSFAKGGRLYGMRIGWLG